jgi:spermidine synthase
MMISELIKTGFSVLKVNDWRTFNYEEKEYGTAKIEKVKYKRGLYLMEGVCGYDFFYVVKPIMINVLKVNGEEFMVDDPLHYYGMKLLADESKGKVLTAGLGLGLYAIFLQSNPNVESVTVIELNNDVKQLIEPMIRKYIKKPTRIVIDDIINWKKRAEDFNTVMLDIWAISKPDTKVYEEMLTMFTLFKFENPNANVYIWGFRDPSINPAVLKLNKKYVEFVKSLMRGD